MMVWYYVYRFQDLIGRTPSFADARRVAVQFCNSKYPRIQIYKQSVFTVENKPMYTMDKWVVTYDRTLDTGRKVTFLYHKEGTKGETSRMLDGSGRYYKDSRLKARQKKNEQYFREMGVL